ncbi:MAG TPA: hypothetical protein VND70_02325, partial [Acidimicrobiales bacterium]|nr:hypothetical protein [Acidimicrobiales bacterium]
MSAVSAPRVLVAWYPDWPVLTTGLPSGLPVAVAAANTVAAVSTAARHTRAWEPAVVAVAAFTPAVEVVAPGEVALSTQGPSRYFGGDEALAEAVAGAVDRSVGHPGCRVGVADGRFAAGLAARVAPAASGPVVVVPRGSSGQWLAPQPVTTLDPVLGSPDLADLLVRMGVRTLGDLAALPYTSVLGRFGPAGATAHRL